MQTEQKTSSIELFAFWISIGGRLLPHIEQALSEINETAILLKEFSYNNICPMEDLKKIEEMLTKCLQLKRDRRMYRKELEKYSRENQVKLLGARLEELI